MPVSVHTPELDRQILQLRRELGDIYDESGNEIVLDTAPGVGQIYVGNTSLISTWRSSELLDCYNTACVRFIEYLTTIRKKSEWHKYIRGYIQYLPTIALATLGSGEKAIPFTTISPPLWYIMDLMVIDGTSLSQTGVEVTADEYFSHKIGVTKTRSTQLLYLIMSIGASQYVILLNEGLSTTNVALTYIKRHVNFIHDTPSPGDATVFTPEGLERVRVFALRIAQRYRSQEAQDLPEIDQKLIQDLDTAKLQMKE